MTAAERYFAQEWSVLAIAIAIGFLTLSILSPAFLTEYNLYVVLRSFCVVLVALGVVRIRAFARARAQRR